MLNAIELRRRAASLLDRLETATSRGASDEDVAAITAEVEDLRRQANEAERLEGYRGPTKPEARGGFGYSPMGGRYSRTPENSTAVWLRWVQTGDEGARSEAQAEIRSEYRANATSLNITTPSDGADLVPVGLAERIFAKAREASVWDKLGLTTVRGVGTTVDQPVEGGTLNRFVETAESAENDLDAPAYAKVSFALRKFTKRQDITEELLQDTPTNLMDHISDYVGASYGSTLDYEVVTEALAGGTAGLTADASGAIAGSEIPELAYKLTGGWENGPSVAWLMNRSTEGVIRSIASSSVFTFAPTPGGQMSPQSMLWGWPVYTSGHMPAIAASAKSVILGNWKAMGIRLDPALQLLRDPFSRAAYGEVRLHWKFRLDVEVLNAAGIQYLTHPTS